MVVVVVRNSNEDKDHFCTARNNALTNLRAKGFCKVDQ